MAELLKIEQLSVHLQTKPIVHNLSLHLNCGDILGLVGASGCGKTTLLNAIAGFSRQGSGKIEIAGQVIADENRFVQAEHRHVGMIFQDYALFPHLTVRGNIGFGIEKLAKNDKNERVEYLLNLLKLSDFDDKYPHQLSGGQQQRVAIARALAPQPKLLLLDEPFSNIDARLRTELMLEIKQLLKKFNITAIFVTHNKDEVFTFADKMAVMAHGQILQLDCPANICQQPVSWQVADFLQLGSWLPCEISEQKVVTALGKLHLPSEQYERILQKDVEVNRDKQGLLLKPQHLAINDSKAANAVVEHISLTEQGYHYHLSSIEKINRLSFEKISFYSDKILSIKQQVSLQITAHEPLIFPHN